jgi:hypothetical protein
VPGRARRALNWRVLDPATSLAFVRGADQDPEEIVRPAREIGDDPLAGEVTGSIPA